MEEKWESERFIRLCESFASITYLAHITMEKYYLIDWKRILWNRGTVLQKSGLAEFCFE